MKSLTLFCQLLDDVERQFPEYRRSLSKDRQVICWRVEHEGLSFLAKTLPILGDAIFSALETGRFLCPRNFQSKGALPLLFGGLLKSMFDSVTGNLIEEKDHTAILTEMRQICYFYKKALAASKDEETLDDAARASFISVEADIREDLMLQQEIQSVARLLWNPSTYSDLRSTLPRNGPGGVAETLTSNQKYTFIMSNLVESPAYSDVYDFSFLELNARESRFRKTNTEHARLLSVPKNSTSRRTITVEPCSRMFIQQLLNDHIRRKIELHPLLSKALTLNDQQPSRQRALAASVTRELATVDLSSASDRLSNSLVKCVFAHDSVLLEELQRSRTPTVENRHAVIQLKKYAGMGNATTFPVQSIVFAVLSVFAILRSQKRAISRKNVSSAIGAVTVYGDDIILPCTAYSELAEIMSSFGLKVNDKKSFHLSHFRESCGLDAYRGVEITPVYVRHDLDGEMDPSLIASAIETSNQLFNRGYYKAADYLKKLVESRLGELPLVSDSSSCIGWRDRRGSQTYHRYNTRLMRFETRSYALLTEKRKDPLDGLPGLLSSLIRKNVSEIEQDTQKTCIRGATRMQRRWTA